MTKLFTPALERMATYQLEYEGQTVHVDLIQGTQRSPEFFFHVRFADREYFLHKILFNGQPVWMGREGLDENRKLGEAIESAIGFYLPTRETNDPFRYRGDRTVRIETFQIKEVIIERAKAPFSNDEYYRLHLSAKRQVTIVKMVSSVHQGNSSWLAEETWLPGDEERLSREDFELNKGLLETFEAAYQRGIYKPVRVVEK